MNWVDILILSILILSAAVSLVRGFVREALSLATWIIAVWIAFTFAPSAAVPLKAWISPPYLGVGVAFVLILLSVLLLGSIVNYAMGRVVQGTGLAGTDRLLGVLFGGARGMVLVMMVVAFAAMTPLPKEPWWEQSVLLGHFQRWASRLTELLPADVVDGVVAR
jgi:membrane protein required for colicin V production